MSINKKLDKLTEFANTFCHSISKDFPDVWFHIDSTEEEGYRAWVYKTNWNKSDVNTADFKILEDCFIHSLKDDLKRYQKENKKS